MKPRNRRILQVILYETFAVAFVGPILSLIYDKPISSTLVLAIIFSSIALTWNYVFNALFERWESRQTTRGRSFIRRFIHGLGFEGGLVVMLVPVMAYWLNISALSAFIANLGFFVFFFVYAIVFTWCFDRVFGLPESAAVHGNSQT